MVENMFIDDPHTPQPPQGRVINYLQRGKWLGLRRNKQHTSPYISLSFHHLGGVNRLIVGHKPFADSPTVRTHTHPHQEAQDFPPHDSHR